MVAKGLNSGESSYGEFSYGSIDGFVDELYGVKEEEIPMVDEAM